MFTWPRVVTEQKNVLEYPNSKTLPLKVSVSFEFFCQILAFRKYFFMLFGLNRKLLFENIFYGKSTKKGAKEKS